MENKEKIIPCRKKRLELRETKGFKYTNRIWNDNCLNQSWTIGLMMKVIGNQTFNTYGEWERYYLGSGEKRQNILNAIPQVDAIRLRDLHLNYTQNHNFKKGMTQSTIDINESYGRTMEEISEIGKILFKAVIYDGNPFNLTEEDCINFSFIRIVDEAYIGMERELNTIENLQRLLKDFTVVNTDPDTDRYYAVDAEIYNKEKELICGIQIKSASYYTNNNATLIKTKKFNQDKNEEYTKKTGVPVFYLYSEINGFILNMEVLGEVKKLVA